MNFLWLPTDKSTVLLKDTQLLNDGLRFEFRQSNYKVNILNHYAVPEIDLYANQTA
jgi:hypothetical protein